MSGLSIMAFTCYYGIAVLFVGYSSALDTFKSGPCNESVPCVSGERFADPASCSQYYECLSDGSAFALHTCDQLENFDEGQLLCVPASEASCLLSCEPLIMLDNNNITNNGTNNGTSSITEAMQPADDGDPAEEDSKEEWIDTKVVEEDKEDPVTSEANKPLTSDDKLISTDQNELETTDEETTQSSSTTSTTTTTTTTTTAAPTTTTTATRLPTDSVVVMTTEEPVQTSTANSSSPGSSEEAQVLSAKTIGIISGVVIAVLLVLALIIGIIVAVVLRRKKYRKHHPIEKFENPQYSRADRPGPKNLTFPRQSTLTVEPTVNFSQVNNNDSNPGEKTKRPAPPAPSPSGKRPAPAPPALKAADLYEKDTPPGSTDNIPLSTFTVSNPTVPSSKTPLLTPPNGQVGEEDSKRALPAQAEEDSKRALLAQAEDDGISIDSYDREKNPFFSD